ncbi:MAG TPA: hypothetical protein VFV27_03160 [Nevskiaceae bacterium]|nr:hypothetical protein [Nevskiaceae bacterium]
MDLSKLDPALAVIVPVATPPAPAPLPAAPPPITGLRSRQQHQADTLAGQASDRLHWKQRLPAAQATWPKIGKEELAAVQGNVHRLAGLVQLRHRVSREQADAQVLAFLAPPKAAPKAPPEG